MAGISDVLRFVEPREIEPFLDKITPAQRVALDLINQKVAAAESLPGVLTFVYESSRDFFPCDRISISFLEDQGRRVVARWTKADYEPVFLRDGFTESLAGSSLSEVVKRGVPRIISNLEQYLAEKPKSVSTKLLLKEGVRSNLTCPLLVEGRVVGLLFRSSKHPDAYGLSEVAMHYALAERLSQAVEKAWRIDQLTAANNAYLEMLAFASHELRSPLASLIMEGDLLLKEHLGPLSEQQKARVSVMMRRCHDLLAITKDYLDLARYELGNLKSRMLADVPLRSRVLERAVEMVTADFEARRMTLNIQPSSGDERIDCDPELLRTALYNLLSNAARYGREGGGVALTLAMSAADCRISVRNEGAGFAKEERSRLFKRFSRIQSPEFRSIKGTGVGLYLVWQIADLHGGKVFADSEQGSWAEFGIEVPLKQAAAESPGKNLKAR